MRERLLAGRLLLELAHIVLGARRSESVILRLNMKQFAHIVTLLRVFAFIRLEQFDLAPVLIFVLVKRVGRQLTLVHMTLNAAIPFAVVALLVAQAGALIRMLTERILEAL